MRRFIEFNAATFGFVLVSMSFDTPSVVFGYQATGAMLWAIACGAMGFYRGA